MLWEKWRNMGKRKQGIWFTRYAYGHSIWQTQGIWPLCSLGWAGKLGASHTLRLCHSPTASRPGANHPIRAPGSQSKAFPSTLFTFLSPSILYLLSVTCCLQTLRPGLALQILRKVSKPQAMTPAAQGLLREHKVYFPGIQHSLYFS